MTDRRTVLKSSFLLLAAAAAPTAAHAVGFVTGVHSVNEVIVGGPMSASAVPTFARQPLLKWNAVPGATHYSVRVMGPGGSPWGVVTNMPQVQVGVALQVGAVYVAYVAPLDARRNPIGNPISAKFKVVDPKNPR